MTSQQNVVEIDALNEAKQLISPNGFAHSKNWKKWTSFHNWFNELHNYKMTFEMRDVRFDVTEMKKSVFTIFKTEKNVLLLNWNFFFIGAIAMA